MKRGDPPHQTMFHLTITVPVIGLHVPCRLECSGIEHLLDLSLRLEVVAGDELGDVIIVLIVVVLLVTVLALLLLHALVALGEFAQRCERVWAELVEDAGYELGELLVLTVAVDGEGV